MKKYSKIYSAQLRGLTAEMITIEADISNGLHSFSIVGLGDKTVNESRDRVASAIKNSGFVSPKQKNQKVVISLSPANTRKEGSFFDLGIACAYLLASGQVKIKKYSRFSGGSPPIFLGELSLEGEVRYVRGILPILISLEQLGYRNIFIPKENEPEARMIKDLSICPIANLREMTNYLEGKIDEENKVTHKITQLEKITPEKDAQHDSSIDMQNIQGQEHIKRALEIAAIGRHNVLLTGPPGVGKTMLAKAFLSIMPNLSKKESLEVTSIYSLSQNISEKIFRPPFRAPHHTSSYASLIGGGGSIQPGEITRAHNGILFLDELPEFDRRTIEALRQPLEDKKILLTRLKGTFEYPADCILIAAMNPCPCGFGDSRCNCSERERARYKNKISAAIMDRMDIFLDVQQIQSKQYQNREVTETSQIIRKKIERTREFQKTRDSDLISDQAKNILLTVAEKLRLSSRAIDRVTRVARSIADHSRSESIQKEHLLEALQYRRSA